jgi:sulfatase maturation enzyme AslB (radical SAM superfamily)
MAGEMKWRSLRASLDLGLGSHQPKVSFIFLGGEPLLEFPLIRQAVDYVEARQRPGQRATFRISTNGVLLRPDITRFLEQHHVEVQLSFDGILPAQDLRARGTFPTLDELSNNLRKTRPVLFRESLRISVTLIPPAIGYLADSVSYLLGKGCRKIAIDPPITNHPGWKAEGEEKLECQFSHLVDISLDHFRRTREVPLLLFGPIPRRSKVKQERGMCGAIQGRNLAVDVDGKVYGCALCIESVQEFRSPLLQRLSRTLKIGPLNSEFPIRYQEFLEKADREDLLICREKKHSGYGRCADCRYFADCAICPVSIAQSPGNTDPHRVPDFTCAFNRVALKYRRLFRRKALQARGAYLDHLMRQFHEMVRESRPGGDALWQNPADRRE